MKIGGYISLPLLSRIRIRQIRNESEFEQIPSTRIFLCSRFYLLCSRFFGLFGEQRVITSQIVLDRFRPQLVELCHIGFEQLIAKVNPLQIAQHVFLNMDD